MLEGLGAATFEHTSLIVDEDRHLRLVYYALRDEQDTPAFHAWLREGSSESA
ncbi:hypothetical protein B0H98_103184 [Vreelandella songnenensis]|uniref:Uncharacterized protein n=1 Tax=Vreelandella songnenensis TaxID=1176243 RepID=A0A2T0V4Z3_9GAMM|nr:hypothetical protein [Halomonas songnenensis]PRY65241.1 hypothetical protein B0H98_103184 [Halomonas songnenensis]